MAGADAQDIAGQGLGYGLPILILILVSRTVVFLGLHELIDLPVEQIDLLLILLPLLLLIGSTEKFFK